MLAIIVTVNRSLFIVWEKLNQLKRVISLNFLFSEIRSNKYCDQCGLTLSTKQALTRHIKVVHLRIKAFKCRFCGKAYGQSFDRYLHEQNQHLAKSWRWAGYPETVHILPFFFRTNFICNTVLYLKIIMIPLPAMKFRTAHRWWIICLDVVHCYHGSVDRKKYAKEFIVV